MLVNLFSVFTALLICWKNGTTVEESDIPLCRTRIWWQKPSVIGGSWTFWDITGSRNRRSWAWLPSRTAMSRLTGSSLVQIVSSYFSSSLTFPDWMEYISFLYANCWCKFILFQASPTHRCTMPKYSWVQFQHVLKLKRTPWGTVAYVTIIHYW